MPESITVLIVDGDESVRRALARMMRAGGFESVCVDSVDSLLQQDLPASAAVLLIDVKTARQSGISLHEQLDARALKLPVIYLTDCETERSRSQAKLLGAAGYFRKPVDDQALLDAITFAIQNDKAFDPKASAGFS